MRVMPHMTVIAPADSSSTKQAVWATARHQGPTYLSFTRIPVPHLYTADFPFQIGKAVVVREGCDATIVANRDMVAQSLMAAEKLLAEGLDVRVIDSHTLKPLDKATIIQAAQQTGALVTAENNVFYGGLGSAVAEVLGENCPVPMKRIGVRDQFAESGPYLALLDKYGLSARHVAAAVRHVVARKRLVA